MRTVPLLLFALMAATACQKDSPPTPSPSPSPDGTETIRGTERLGWDQRATDTAELATFRYAVYVDGNRSEMADVSCGSAVGANGFPCSGRLPSMSAGQHTLELASFTIDAGTTLESGRSAPLRVNVTASLVGARAGSVRSGAAGATRDGVPLRLDVVADGLDEPGDIAVAPDGRVFIAERDGIVRAIDRHGTQATTEIGGGIVALAIDADFERTHLVFVAAAVADPADSGRATLTVARFREMNGTLGERMVLLHGVAARTDRTAAALGIGPDDKLYVALDDGGHAAAPDEATSLNGKLLRLNADGTTPADRVSGSAVESGGYRSPRALAWATTDVLWIADGAPRSPERLTAFVAAPRRRLDPQMTYALPPDTEPSDAIVYRGELFGTFRGNLLVASEAGYVLRLVFDPRDPTRVVATERLLEGIGPVRAIAEAPDGAIYIVTPRSIARLSPRQMP